MSKSQYEENSDTFKTGFLFYFHILSSFGTGHSKEKERMCEKKLKALPGSQLHLSWAQLQRQQGTDSLRSKFRAKRTALLDVKRDTFILR